LKGKLEDMTSKDCNQPSAAAFTALFTALQLQGSLKASISQTLVQTSRARDSQKVCTQKS